MDTGEEEVDIPDDERIIVVLDQACLEVGKTKGVLTLKIKHISNTCSW